MMIRQLVVFVVLLAQAIATMAGDFNTDSISGTWIVDVEATENNLKKNPPPQSNNSDWFAWTFGMMLASIIEIDKNGLSYSMYTIPEKRRGSLVSKGNNELTYSLEGKKDHPKPIDLVITPVDSEHIHIVTDNDRWMAYIVWKRTNLDPARRQDPNKRMEDGKRMLEIFGEVAPRFQEILNKGTYKEATWIDDVLLHDGRIVEVQRKVVFYRNSPDDYSFQVLHPDTGQLIAWKGERYVRPVLLDFVNGAAYLAIFSSREVFLNPKLYGCPELPYLFYKYDNASSRWELLQAAMIPRVLSKANMSMRYDGTYMKDGTRQSVSDITRRNPLYAAGSGGLFDINIPRSFDDWHYPRKARFINERYPGDCRPALPTPVDSINPKDPKPETQHVELEILDTKDFNPDWVLSTDSSGKTPSEWAKHVFDSDRSKACAAYFKPAKPDNPKYDGWKSFVMDETGKIVTASGYFLCEKNVIWFIDYVGGGDRILLIKVTPTGEVIYRAGFIRPDTVKGYLGGIAYPSFRTSDGYVYFEWWYSNSNARQRYVKQVLKVRFREP